MVLTSAGNPILVTGATGQHGGTSAHVVSSLIDSGKSVRVFARSKSEKTETLQELGAEIVLGDFNDRQSIISALEGVETATFTYPIASGIVHAAATFASAARSLAKPPRVVVMSMAVAHPESPSHLGRAQWLAEETLAWSGLDLTILRVAALFFENITFLHGDAIRDTSSFGNSFGLADVPWISGLDAARLMVSAVLRPELFSNSIIQYPPGVELLNHDAIATIISREVGVPINFRPISEKEWEAELLEEARAHPGGFINADMAKHISAVGAALAKTTSPSRIPDSLELEKLTGHAPYNFRQFVRANLSTFVS
ncbi:NmrA family NAD(P)-binding protein [Pararhizobium sp. PWRC1-1]|uniref:NmrA family NAD(P)-binding protein n=1 Tax=Pararhizobium sp. PWRC1-1 TaxID=2804566 RepID=UPI003CED50CE